MNAQRLLEDYQSIADTPDAIARLRPFILELATRGQLVPQDPEDEPAAELLKQIASERARLRKAKPLSEIARDEVPFTLPLGWLWVRLGTIGSIFNGNSINAAEKAAKYAGARGLPYIATKDVGYGLDPLDYENGIRIPIGEEKFKVAHQGAVLICAEGGSAGKKCGLVSQHVCFGNKLFANELYTAIPPRFILYFYLSKIFMSQFDSSKSGIIGGVSIAKFTQLLAPLPPLAEQHRIVTRVDELMALCDRLEAARADREAIRDRITTATLARLNAPDPGTFRDNARFAINVLPTLTTRADQLKQLRQTILDLALRGKLVPQDPNDEPTSELLKRIVLERAELQKRLGIRSGEVLDPVDAREWPFPVPENWTWSRIGAAVLFTQYGTSEKAHVGDKGVPVLTMGNIRDGAVVLGNEKRIPETSDDLPHLYLQKFDLLYNRTNSAELVGKTGIYLGESNVRTFASYLVRIRPSQVSGCPRYLNLAMNTPAFRQTQIIPLIKKQTGQANVNATALKNMLVPIAPLSEQRRIVTKVEELMAPCDRLEATLTTCDDTRRRLLDALLAEALTPGVA